jgi:YD repeat-containing protein
VEAGGAVRWSSGTGGSVLFASDGAGGWLSPPGVYASLRLNPVSGLREAVDRDSVVSVFDAGGRLVSIKDRSGQGVTLAYDGSGRLSTVTDAAGRATTFTYGTTGAAAGRVTQVTAPGPRTVRYGYVTVAGKVVMSTFTDERGKVFTNSYDAGGYLTKITDPNGNVEFTNSYDALGRVLTQADALGNVSTFSWSAGDGVLSFTDASGAVRMHDYNGNVLMSRTDPAGSSATGYNAALDATSFTDPSGATWTATYDARGNMVSRTAPAPLSYVESWTYDGFNNPLTYTDARGNTTSYAYDGSGRVVSVTRPGGVTSAWSYNADGTVATETDPRGGVTSYAYTANGQVASVSSPLGNVTTYAYDAAGRVVTITEPRGNVAGAVAANFQRKFTYDTAGNVLTERDALNRTTTHVYDNAGRRTRTTNPDGGITLYGYNAANEVVSI